MMITVMLKKIKVGRLANASFVNPPFHLEIKVVRHLKELCRKCHAKESAELLNALDVGEEVKKGKQINSLNNNRNNSFVYQMTPLLLIKRTLPRLMK